MSGFKSFDDDHAPAAARTGFEIISIPVCLIFAGIIRLMGQLMGMTEQFADFGDVAGTVAIGKQACVADTVEAPGQNMDEETANELMDGKRHEFLPISSLSAVILPFEGDGIAIGGNQPAVGYRHPVGIAGEVC